MPANRRVETALNDDERKALSDRVRDANKRSSSRPR
jgi:hypothetical protein